MDTAPDAAAPSRSARALSWFRGLSRGRKIALIVGVAVIAIIVLLVIGNGAAEATTVPVVRGSVSSDVQVLGTLEAVESVDLAFGASGRVSSVGVKVGDRVARGALLASLDNAELNADLRDAQASLLVAQADSQGIESGNPAEVDIAEAGVREAEQDLSSAYGNTYQALSDAYSSAVSALHIALYPLFDDEGGSSGPAYRLTFDTSDYARETAATDARADAEEALIAWRASLADIADGATPEEYAAATAEAKAHIVKVNAVIAAVSQLLTDNASVGIGLEDSTFEDYRSRVNDARSDAAQASRTVNDHEQLLVNSALDLRAAQSELDYTVSHNAPDVAIGRARVLAAQAKVDRIHALIAKNLIRSPLGGVVTRVDAKVGQTAQSGTPLVAVFSDSGLQVAADVPEVGIGEVAVGDSVVFRVDALPGQLFDGSVAAVDPAETVVDGVVNFAVTVAIASADARLRSGMTADIAIEGDRRDDVLVVPLRALIENGDGSFVDLVTDAGTVRTKVEPGLKGADGSVEIISGLSEGDLILVPAVSS